MHYDKIKLLAYIESQKSSLTPGELLHIVELSNFIKADASLKEIFLYGKKYLPNIIDKNGKKDLNLLQGYVPDIVPYFEVLADSDALPYAAKEIATDFSLYANGSSLQIDNELYSMDLENKLDKIK